MTVYTQNRQFACKLSCCFLQFSPTFIKYIVYMHPTLRHQPSPLLTTRSMMQDQASWTECCPHWLHIYCWMVKGWSCDMMLDIRVEIYNEKVTHLLKENHFCVNTLIRLPTWYCTFSILRNKLCPRTLSIFVAFFQAFDAFKAIGPQFPPNTSPWLLQILFGLGLWLWGIGWLFLKRTAWACGTSLSSVGSWLWPEWNERFRGFLWKGETRKKELVMPV